MSARSHGSSCRPCRLVSKATMQTRTSTRASMPLKRFQACVSLCTALSPPLLAASLVEGGEWANQTKGRMLLYAHWRASWLWWLRAKLRCNQHGTLGKMLVLIGRVLCELHWVTAGSGSGCFALQLHGQCVRHFVSATESTGRSVA
jgi:hypothetical protein